MPKNVLHFALEPAGIYNEKYHAIVHLFLNEYYDFFLKIIVNNAHDGFLGSYACQTSLSSIHKELRSIINCIDSYDNNKDGKPVGNYKRQVDRYQRMFEENAGKIFLPKGFSFLTQEDELKIKVELFKEGYTCSNGIEEVAQEIKHRANSKLFNYYSALYYTHSQTLDWIYKISPDIYQTILLASNTTLIDFICNEANRVNATDVVIGSFGPRYSYARDLEAKINDGSGLFMIDIEIIQQAIRKLLSAKSVRLNSFLSADIASQGFGESAAKGKQSYKNKLRGRRDSLVHVDKGFNCDVVTSYAVSHQSYLTNLTAQEKAEEGSFTFYIVHHSPQQISSRIREYSSFFPSVEYVICKYNREGREPVIDSNVLGQGVENKFYAEDLANILNAHSQEHINTMEIDSVFQELASLRGLDEVGKMTISPQKESAVNEIVVPPHAALQMNSVFQPSHREGHHLTLSTGTPTTEIPTDREKTP